LLSDMKVINLKGNRSLQQRAESPPKFSQSVAQP